MSGVGFNPEPPAPTAVRHRPSKARGVCVNHDCDLFEYPVRGAYEDDRCEECGQALLHESGLTWDDAREKGLAP